MKFAPPGFVRLGVLGQVEKHPANREPEVGSSDKPETSDQDPGIHFLIRQFAGFAKVSLKQVRFAGIMVFGIQGPCESAAVG